MELTERQKISELLHENKVLIEVMELELEMEPTPNLKVIRSAIRISVQNCRAIFHRVRGHL